MAAADVELTRELVPDELETALWSGVALVPWSATSGVAVATTAAAAAVGVVWLEDALVELVELWLLAATRWW